MSYKSQESTERLNGELPLIPTRPPLYSNLSSAKAKQCFCIGPDKCNDETCELVKRYKRQFEQSKARVWIQ